MQDILNAPTRATPTAQSAPRVDLYAPIHKALRSFTGDTLARAGRLDTDDAEEFSITLGQLDVLLALCASHIAHENGHVHPAIEAREPGAAQRIAHEHQDHLQAIDDLGCEARALRGAPASERPLRALRLYRHLALFIADNLQHMHIEETAHNAALWARYSDAELGVSRRWSAPALRPRRATG
ncbi:hemerythrin domain-containing protein [Methylibium sp.]|uniref:hemerythrin domain-containing protein n=1 Tax=Methylibium sp. TaxID=2067992 RepID=UPI003D100710